MVVSERGMFATEDGRSNADVDGEGCGAVFGVVYAYAMQTMTPPTSVTFQMIDPVQSCRLFEK